MVRLLFFVTFIIFSFTCFSQIGKVNVIDKMSPALKKMYENINATDSIEILVASSKYTMPSFAVIKKEYKEIKSFVIKLKSEQLHDLINEPYILFADLLLLPKEEVTTGYLDINTNKINIVHSEYPSINGDGILVSIKENKLDTTDIDFIGRYINSGIASPIVTTHASIIGTAIAGAANSSPFAKGVAIKSKLTSSNFSNLLPDPDSIFLKYNISIQNHSYGTAIQNYYGIEAMAYDLQVNRISKLLHVFSSGNAGMVSAPDGKFKNIEGFANLTANFKMAKNILTVGAIDSVYNLSQLSSKGPAYDGRIKPEIVAFGEDGSSGAAAIVSGASALVQDAYKQKFNRLPESGTTKAVLINSADYPNNSTINFSTGYGILNVYNSIKTIVNNQIFEGIVSKSGEKLFTIEIPDNTNFLKVTLVWNDPAATVNAEKALINDLDLIVTNNETGENWQPWILNLFPDKDSLMLPATRGIDTLNNIEQVSIDNPKPGNYTLKIKGSNLNTGQQDFVIAYHFSSNEDYKWTFPTKNDIVISGETNILRWQTNYTGVATVDFSIDGESWQQIAILPDAKIGYYRWNTPHFFSGGLLRMKLNNASHVSDTFIVSNTTSLHTGFNCSDSFLLYWNSLPVAEYQLYKLDNNYLQPFLVTSDTTVILAKSDQKSVFYSVAPIVNNKPGLKSYTINYETQGVECYFRGFYLQMQTSNEAIFNASIGSNYNVSTLTFEKLINNQFLPVSTISAPLINNVLFKDTSLLQGVNIYRLKIKLINGEILYSNQVTIYHFTTNEVIVYPNPVKQNQPVNLITSKAGRVEVDIFTSSGYLYKKFRLSQLHQSLPSFSLSKGIYFIRIKSEDGGISTQKIIVQ